MLYFFYLFDDKIICGTRGWSIIDENADDEYVDDFINQIQQKTPNFV